MEPVIWEREPPHLRSPVLVASFSGWNDAATSASNALEAVASSLGAELVAKLDPEGFYDFQANRPQIRVAGGRLEGVSWPSNAILAAEAPLAERDLVIISGTEPSTRWRTYCETVLDVAEAMGAEMLVTMGALIADVAHTRPVPITGLASDAEMIATLGVDDVNYEGPTGITGVLHDAARRRELPSASLWAAVPHYAAAVPNPRASLALVRRLESLIGIAVEASELEEAGERFVAQLDRAVAANPEIKEMVTRLEQQQDDAVDLSADLPSGDAIANELQRYLRQRSAEDEEESGDADEA